MGSCAYFTRVVWTAFLQVGSLDVTASPVNVHPVFTGDTEDGRLVNSFEAYRAVITSPLSVNSKFPVTDQEFGLTHVYPESLGFHILFPCLELYSKPIIYHSHCYLYTIMWLPPLQAVCCSDGVHCCPHGSTCDITGKCAKGSDILTWMLKTSAAQVSLDFWLISLIA